MKYFLGVFICLFILLPAHCQNIKGVVMDINNEPVAAASIYVAETKHGTITNKDGEFSIKLSPGTYHIEVRSMGYEPEDLTISLGNSDVEETIVLLSRDIQLREVQISQGEDRAYEIIRQTIKKAPYYRSIIKSAVYENYAKGSGKFVGIPKLVEATADEEDMETLDMYKDRLFLQESLSEMQYTAPDKYEQTVKAYSSSMPFMNDPKHAMGIGMISLYNPMWGNTIAPLNPKAFSYYKFRYEGYEEEDGQIINIIRIIPKLKDPKLIEGVIHIADEEWSIRYFSYKIKAPFIDAHYTLNLNLVVDDVYLVTNYDSQVDANIFGVKFKMQLLTSIQYKDVQLNDSLLLTQQETKPLISEKRKKEKKSLEIKREVIEPVVDSLAVKRDSAYWAHARSVVLDQEELQSYQYKDTLKQKQDSLSNRQVNPQFSPMDLITGGTLGSDSSLMYFRYNGLIRGVIREYNYVDGWWLGQSFELDFKKQKNNGLIIKPEVYWASSRKSLVWNLDMSLDYAPRRLGNLSFSAGQMSEDYSGQAGMNRRANYYISLLTGRNYAKFYDSKYLRLQNTIDIANGLQLTLRGEYARSLPLDIHTKWNVFGIKDKARPNRPSYAGSLNGEFNHHAKLSAHLRYTPEYYYRIEEGKKQYVKSRFPTFELDYRHGLSPELVSNNSNYHRLEFSVSQSLKLSYFSRLSYKLIAGKFLNDNAFNYIDYKHFNATGPWFSLKSWNESYALLPYYTYSTGKKWVQAFINYDTDYLVLKRLPFMQGKMLTEALHFKFLHTPDKRYYSEWGYSVNLPFEIGAIGVFAGFNKFSYDGIGLQFSLPLIGNTRKSNTISISF